MKVLLSIGYTDILLPSDTNLATLLKVLGGGIEVEDKRYCKGGLVFREHVQVKAEMLPGQVKVTMPKATPEPEPLCLPAPQSILL